MSDKLLGIMLLNKGLEETATGYLKEYGCKNVLLKQGFVVFEASMQDLCRLSYLNQLGSKILLVLGKSDIKKIGPLFFKSSLDNMPEIISFNTFKIDAHESLIESMAEAVGSSKKVDLRNPDITFTAVLDAAELYFCIDFSSEISKRDYKIFHTPASLKGTTAFGILKLAGYCRDKKMLLLDPYCADGSIIIEAALYSSNTSPRRYSKDLPFKKFLPEKFCEEIFEKADMNIKSEALTITATDPLMRHVTAARKNAKIAGVEKSIGFRRIDADWLDFKFEKRSIDLIITFLPMRKSYKDLFYNAEYIIKKKGTMAVLCISKDLLKEACQYFVLKDEKIMYSGSQMMYLLFFGVKQ